jgi:large subunit ribosomal protein L17
MAYSKLGRTSSQRKALLRDLATDLIINERIQTTEQKAKELRQVASFVRKENAGEKDAIQKLFEDVAPRYAERQGGYTRIMKVGPRRGDGAEVVIIELV